MKKQFSGFLTGVLLTTMIFGMCTGALAATGKLTLEVDPINIQVNSQTFAPKDAQGNSVPVFAYNGTTYAPLRALAEAYGLEVGYDDKTNMATVGKKGSESQTISDKPSSPDYSKWTEEKEKAYQEFKEMWVIQASSTNNDGIIYSAKYKGTLSEQALITKLQDSEHIMFAERLAWETYNGTLGLYLVFYGSGDGLGSILISDGKLMQSYFPKPLSSHN